MSRKNLIASNKTHKFLLYKLHDKKIFQIYNKFEKQLKLNNDFIVAVSGGPDSLALSFLSKIYSIKKSLNIKYYLVDHKLRKNSSTEAQFVKKLLTKLNVKLKILNWVGSKPISNIQSIARNKRYNLLINEAKKLKIKNILLGHHKGDLYENFFIRILRGSGLNGLTSFGEKSKVQEINLVRPLLKFDKKDLVYIAENLFKTYIEDPSNQDNKFKRVKIRNLITNLQTEGLNLDKFNLTIKNLKFANQSILFFTEKNIKDNATLLNDKKSFILSKEFFNYPKEVVFRALSEIIKIVGKNYYPTRGKKIDRIIDTINKKTSFKITLGNCLIKKVNQTVIVSKEH